MTMVPFPPDVSWIQEGRSLEVEAIAPGQSTARLMGTPSQGTVDEEASVVMSEVSEIQDVESRVRLLEVYVPHARQAFRDRELRYPFTNVAYGSSLTVLPGSMELAKSAAELTELVSRGGPSAKEFEVRATRALRRLVGGWAVCVGFPREDTELYGGMEKAVMGFRKLLEKERGDFLPDCWPPGGDDGLDAIFLLGRSWGGPLVLLQSKNSSFEIKHLPTEFLRMSDICHTWFGRPIAKGRAVVPVYAVNSVLTHEMKECVYAAGNECHIIDAVDILLAESLPADQPRYGESLLVM